MKIITIGDFGNISESITFPSSKKDWFLRIGKKVLSEQQYIILENILSGKSVRDISRFYYFKYGKKISRSTIYTQYYRAITKLRKFLRKKDQNYVKSFEELKNKKYFNEVLNMIKENRKISDIVDFIEDNYSERIEWEIIWKFRNKLYRSQILMWPK